MTDTGSLGDIMKKMKIDGYDFEGAYIAGKGEVPSIGGIALIVSEAGEGAKIIAVAYGDNLLETVDNSPDLPEWTEHAYHGIVDIYVLEMESPKREAVAESIINKRKNTLTCQKIKEIVDDW